MQDASADVSPRKISRKATGVDAVFVHSIRLVGATVLVITGGVGIFLGWQALPTLQRYGLGFFTETAVAARRRTSSASPRCSSAPSRSRWSRWSSPSRSRCSTALYISEYAPAGSRASLVSLVDLMAAVPSIIYGLWGFFLIMPHAADLALWLHQQLRLDPVLRRRRRPERRDLGQLRATLASAFCAGIAVAMMVMPMACAVMRQVFSQTPPGEKEAALALGATKWGMIRSVVLPFGRGGIIGGTMLGLGRALGETIAVLLIISPGLRASSGAILEIGTQHRLAR